MKDKLKTISYESRVQFFWVLTGISVLSLFVYIYAVASTAKNIALSENLEEKITSVLSELEPLEFTYIELKNSVTLELANSLGFKEIKNPLYISRNEAPSLSFNTVRR